MTTNNQCSSIDSSKKETGTEGKDMNAVLEAVKHLTDKVDTLSLLQHNSIMLTSIAKAVELNAAEMKDCKMQLQSTVRDVSALKKENAELKERVLEQQDKRPWNLKIRGLKVEFDRDQNREH